ncbi:hypothetical protein MTO96_003704 [Rhipicephalus appendiculatus]
MLLPAPPGGKDFLGSRCQPHQKPSGPQPEATVATECSIDRHAALLCRREPAQNSQGQAEPPLCSRDPPAQSRVKHSSPSPLHLVPLSGLV